MKTPLRHLSIAPSGEDATMELLNEAADAARFKITSIHMTQTRDGEPGKVKVAVSVDGIGSSLCIAAFLRHIMKQDPLIYEEKLQLTRAVEDAELLHAEAQLGMNFIENTGVLS